MDRAAVVWTRTPHSHSFRCSSTVPVSSYGRIKECRWVQIIIIIHRCDHCCNRCSFCCSCHRCDSVSNICNASTSTVVVVVVVVVAVFVLHTNYLVYQSSGSRFEPQTERYGWFRISSLLLWIVHTLLLLLFCVPFLPPPLSGGIVPSARILRYQICHCTVPSYICIYIYIPVRCRVVLCRVDTSSCLYGTNKQAHNTIVFGCSTILPYCCGPLRPNKSNQTGTTISPTEVSSHQKEESFISFSSSS